MIEHMGFSSCSYCNPQPCWSFRKATEYFVTQQQCLWGVCRLFLITVEIVFEFGLNLEGMFAHVYFYHWLLGTEQE